MFRFALAASTLAIAAAALAAEPPLVPAFARFHAAEPTAEAGRLLLGELNCTRCHAAEGGSPKGAPILDGAGARLQADWLREFLTNPPAARPGTTMPDVLADLGEAERAAAVEALVHFLGSQKSGWKPPKLAKYSAPHTGGALFQRVGCAACHADPLKSEPSPEHRAAGLVSLENLAAKYSYPALTSFLQEPLKHRPGGRMPDLALLPQEAADIAAYLLDTLDLAENDSRAPLRAFNADAAKAKAGAAIFRSAGCANCHPLADQQPALEPPPLAALIGKPAACRQAAYPHSAPQRAALDMALAAPMPEPDAKARARHALAALNCYACHQRDGIGGPAEMVRDAFTGNETLGNEGRFPPHLTGVGQKLQPDWLKAVLAGKGRVRPYLHTRMPVFGDANAAPLAADLLVADGAPDADPAKAFAAGDAAAGRKLLGTEGGVGCITCHGIGDRKGLAMEALSLTGAAQRYQPAWFKHNLIAPMEARPGTLMPSFWPGGVAGNRTILDGDTDRQIAAIWRYLAVGTELPPGFPDFDQGEFEIIPAERPVVQRAFMEIAGTHAVAVGFPQGIHFAFDADACRVAAVWRGRFIDGYNAWFSRKDPTAEPLGDSVKVLGSGDGDSERRFRGYTLDKAGVPTFLYAEGDAQVAERIEPDGGGGFARKVTRTARHGAPKSETSTIAW